MPHDGSQSAFSTSLITKTLSDRCTTLDFVDFFGALIEKIESVGFAPLAPFEKSKRTYTLHTVVRDQLGMAERREVALPSVKTEESQSKQVEVHITSDMADVAYWNYRELRAFLTTIHNMMNEEISVLVGKSTVAIAWAHDQSRTQDEIIGLFKISNSANTIIPTFMWLAFYKTSATKSIV